MLITDVAIKAKAANEIAMFFEKTVCKVRVASVSDSKSSLSGPKFSSASTIVFNIPSAKALLISKFWAAAKVESSSKSILCAVCFTATEAPCMTCHSQPKTSSLDNQLTSRSPEESS